MRKKLHDCNDERLFVVFEAIKRGVSCGEIHEITRIDLWFLHKLKNLVRLEKEMARGLTDELYLEAKKRGYPDKVIERIAGTKIDRPRQAVFKMVDTCAAEFSAETLYLLHLR